jgi:hypothetical protein
MSANEEQAVVEDITAAVAASEISGCEEAEEVKETLGEVVSKRLEEDRVGALAQVSHTHPYTPSLSHC